jgi:hypothetical protein
MFGIAPTMLLREEASPASADPTKVERALA